MLTVSLKTSMNIGQCMTPFPDRWLAGISPLESPAKVNIEYQNMILLFLLAIFSCFNCQLWCFSD